MFDRRKFSQCIKNSKYTSKTLLIELNNKGVDIGLSTLESYRKGNIGSPPVENLDEVANIINCSVQDFFTDADKKREQITLDEIISNPQKYSKSISKVYEDTLSGDLKELLNNFQILPKDDREKYLSEIKEKALNILNGD